MSNARSVLRALIDLSHDLGRPERDLVILGEGNTSALVDDGTFWVKGSGTQLATVEEDGFVRMYVEPVCALADRVSMTDDEFKEALEAAKADPSQSRRPSTETVLHALALCEAGARFVGHTHPVAVNALMCSLSAEKALSGRLFPDEIVVCGPAPAYIPYADPGLPLAKAVREGFRRFADKWGMPPKTIFIQNHGLIALGETPTQINSITDMAVKTCRILAGTYIFGGPHFLSEEHHQRIFTRPDESYRRQQLKLE
ncbi:MAG: class II aldolase/adducin family protein [Chloroflexi bacterium]|nr:class II aldolase/adducin family protein [Chloroflexota bacterium]